MFTRVEHELNVKSDTCCYMFWTLLLGHTKWLCRNLIAIFAYCNTMNDSCLDFEEYLKSGSHVFMTFSYDLIWSIAKNQTLNQIQ